MASVTLADLCGTKAEMATLRHTLRGLFCVALFFSFHAKSERRQGKSDFGEPTYLGQQRRAECRFRVLTVIRKKENYGKKQWCREKVGKLPSRTDGRKEKRKADNERSTPEGLKLDQQEFQEEAEEMEGRVHRG